MIKVEHINKKYGKKLVLEDINFQAEVGEQISIIGKNGCGKTTLMQILAGIIKPNSGNITYFNQEPLKKFKLFRKFCGYIPQENPLMEEISVKENLKLWAGKSAEIDSELEKIFELKEIMNVRVDKLSGGMKRRVSIACALTLLPPIMLMDEPTAAIDLYYKKSIHKWMDYYLKMNGIIIMTTHDEQEILNSNRCILMQNGKMKELEENERNLTKIYDFIRM